MAYDSTGMYCVVNSAHTSVWMLRTTDAIGTSAAAGYISNAGTAGTGGVAGKGVKIADLVFIQVVDSVSAPTSVSDVGLYYVSAINASTGAATLTAAGAT